MSDNTKSSLCYAVLWIPTITHKMIVGNPIIDNHEIIRTISDDGQELRIKVRLNDDNSIDVITVDKNDNETSSFFLKLNYVDDSRNGLIEYSYKEKYMSNETTEGFRFTHDTFPEAVYHIIKEFFHEHEFHESDCDTHLRPYISDTKVNLHDTDNPALHHYLKCYEAVMSNLVFYAHNALLSIRNREIKENEIIERYVSYEKISIKAKGYEAYLNALYDSIYNTKCRIADSTDAINIYLSTDDHDKINFFISENCYNNGIEELEAESEGSESQQESEEIKNEKSEKRKEMRRRAFNIQNSINYFKALDVAFHDFIQEHNFKAQDKLLTRQLKNAKTSYFWAIFSIIVGAALSVFVTYCSSRKSTKDLEKVKVELLQKMDTLSSVTTPDNSVNSMEINNTEPGLE